MAASEELKGETGIQIAVPEDKERDEGSVAEWTARQTCSWLLKATEESIKCISGETEKLDSLPLPSQDPIISYLDNSNSLLNGSPCL